MAFFTVQSQSELAQVRRRECPDLTEAHTYGQGVTKERATHVDSLAQEFECLISDIRTPTLVDVRRRRAILRRTRRQQSNNPQRATPQDPQGRRA